MRKRAIRGRPNPFGFITGPSLPIPGRMEGNDQYCIACLSRQPRNGCTDHHSAFRCSSIRAARSPGDSTSARILVSP